MSNLVGRPRIYPDVSLICRQCEKTFFMRGGEARGYEKKHGRVKPYCSMECFYNAAHRHARDLAEEAPIYLCEGCGQETRRRRDILRGARKGGWDLRQKYCSIECFHRCRFTDREKQRSEGILPKGIISKDGYHVIKVAHGQQIRMHRFIMEQRLGRKLRRNENVHHINGNRSDNRPENLELWVKTQPCGQRAVDKVKSYLNFLCDYPELVKEAGYHLVKDRGG